MTAARSRLLDDARRAGLLVQFYPDNAGVVLISKEDGNPYEVDGVVVLPDGSALTLPIRTKVRNPRSFREVREALGITP